MTNTPTPTNQLPDSSLLSIGDFARAASLSVSAVRFYADRGVLVPATTDAATGYRYFSESQVAIAALVRDLRRIDMPLSEVTDVIGMPAESRGEAINSQIRRLEQRLEEARQVAKQLDSATSSDVTGLRARDLAHAIGQVVPVAGVDQRSPHMMCVRVEVRDGSVRLVATDSYRLTVRDLALAAVGAAFSVVVAAAALREWPAVLASTDAVSLEVDNGVLVARADGIELRCPVIPAEFPDYEGVLSSSSNTASVVAERQQLLSTLDSLAHQATVVLSATNGELSITPDRLAHADAWAAVNPRFAAQAIEHAVGVELAIEIDDPNAPVTFRSADDGTYTSLLMPVAVSA